MKYLVMAILLCIVISMGLALKAMYSPQKNPTRMVKLLMLRVGLSLGLFLVLMIFFRLGWLSNQHL